MAAVLNARCKRGGRIEGAELMVSIARLKRFHGSSLAGSSTLLILDGEFSTEVSNAT